MNTSSVHLRDLDNLVSRFTDKKHSAFHIKDRLHNPKFLVFDGVSSVEEGRNDVLNHSSILPQSGQSMVDKIQHVTQISQEGNLLAPVAITQISQERNLLAPAANASSELHFGEQRFHGTASNQLHIVGGRPLDSLSSVIETDPYDTQHRKNSLHLINELCERLAATDPETGKDSSPSDYTHTETETMFVTTPISSASQFIPYHNNITDLSCANASTCEQISAMEFSTTFGLSDYNTGSCSCVLADPHNYLISTHNRHATESGNEEILAQFYEPFGTCCEAFDAVSCMEDMVEKIPPPLQSDTPMDATYNPCKLKISQLLPDRLQNFAPTDSNTGRCLFEWLID